MAKVLWKGSAMLSPLPAVLVSCGDMEKPNVMTAAWTGIINSQPPKTYVSIRKERFSYGIISEKKEFTINLTTERLAYATDLCGVKSGRDTDKFAAARITPVKSFSINCPSVLESPVSIECRLFDIMDFGSHSMFLADIVSVSVDDTLLDAKGRLMLDKCGLMAYSHGGYFGLGKKLGTFGFSVKK